MSHDEIIEQAARVLCAVDHGDPDDLIGEYDEFGRFTTSEVAWAEYVAQARALSDAGLLARPLPDRAEIAMAIAARHWDRDSGDVEVWHDLTDSEKENVAENYLTWDSAYAVLALLKGQEA